MTQTGPRTYVKKPVAIEAMQLVGNDAVYKWIEENTQGLFDPLSDEAPGSGVSIDPADGNLLIATLEGVMKANPGDWIIRGVQGEFYPCKPDIFEVTYQPAADRAVGAPADERGEQFDRAIAVHDRALREQIARDIEKHYLGPDSGRRFDGRDAPDAAEREAFDEGLQLAARIARGEGSE